MGSFPTSQPTAVKITKQTVAKLEVARHPEPGIILGVRTGKVKALGYTKSGIFKEPHAELVFATHTGFEGDQHTYKLHGGIDRAIHQYNPNHYADWRAEEPPKPSLFDLGGFGENLNSTSLSEENVCVGDVFRVGEDVLLQISEPRHPCYKLNLRFEWPRALKRIMRTGRTGWNYRVLKTGYIRTGDSMTLVERPFLTWSVMNVQRVIRAKHVALNILEECSEFQVLTEQFRNLARRRLQNAPKMYSLIDARQVTARVKWLTFELNDSLNFEYAEFEPYAFAQTRLGPDLSICRSYSIVDGNLRRFSLGVALDDNSRGGSTYLNNQLKIGDKVEMLPGEIPKAAEDDKTCAEMKDVEKSLVVVGGIGVTAFLPSIKQWQK